MSHGVMSSALAVMDEPGTATDDVDHHGASASVKTRLTGLVSWPFGVLALVGRRPSTE